MDADAIESAARRRYNAVNDTFFTQAEIWDLIYFAQKELCAEADLIEGTDTSITTVSGTKAYSFPTGFYKPKRIEYDGDRVTPIDMVEEDAFSLNTDVDAQGTPRSYWVWNETINFAPTPDDAKTVTFYGYKVPSEISAGSDTLEVPSLLHADIVNYVLAEMYAKDGNERMYNTFRSRWERFGISKAKKYSRQQKRGDSFTTVKDAESLPYTRFNPV